MEKLGRETESIMAERFSKDTVIALATERQGRPYVRYVNAYYENRSFYVITFGLSAKMRQMKENPAVHRPGKRGKPGIFPQRGKPGNCREAGKSFLVLDPQRAQ